MLPHVTLGCMLQYVELIYLVSKGYWLYALINALFTCAYTISLLRTVLAHETKMVSLMNRPKLVPIVQGGWVRAAGSHRLVPGDIIVLQRGQATCDLVLLQGSCLVEESMLSGEVGCSGFTQAALFIVVGRTLLVSGRGSAI